MAAAATSLGESHFFEESMNASKVKAYLASSKEAEKSKGIKFLLANMSKGHDMSEFFPDVVKNVVVRAVEIKKMVYMYLVHYADATASCRELALLSINSFQKDLAAANQLIRALALRVMTSIRVPDIIQIQILAVYKCASDSSPYVRRCAANAIPKIYSLDHAQLPALLQALGKLLKDSSTMVLGAAVASFNEVCPNNFEILHRSYRKLCHLLADMDEWTQISVLGVLTRYIRLHFTDPAIGSHPAGRQYAQGRAASSGPIMVRRRVVKKAFYSDEEDLSSEEVVEVGKPLDRPTSNSNPLLIKSADAELEQSELDPDHKLLLRSSLPLLKSRNCGVVLAVCALHLYCGTQLDNTAAQIGKALVRISRNRREIAYVVFKAIVSGARERPQMFRPFLHDFFVKGTDPAFCRVLKLEILTALTDSGNVTQVLKELQSYIKHLDKDFVCATIDAVGRVAEIRPEVADRCLHGLMALIACVRAEKVAGQAINVVRQLLQQSPRRQVDEVTIKQLANVLVTSRGSQIPHSARASLIWIVGEFLEYLEHVAPDMLRLLAKTFPDEKPEVKLQIMNMTMKLHLHRAKRNQSLIDLSTEDNVGRLVRYVLEMARFDSNYDIRDRTRLVTASLGLAAASGQNYTDIDTAALVALRAKAESIFLQAKLPPLNLGTSIGILPGSTSLTVPSLSWMLDHKIPGYQDLPDWADVVVDPGLRDTPAGTPALRESPSSDQSRARSETGSSIFYSEDEAGSSRQEISESGTESEIASSYDDVSEGYASSDVESAHEADTQVLVKVAQPSVRSGTKERSSSERTSVSSESYSSSQTSSADSGEDEEQGITVRHFRSDYNDLGFDSLDKTRVAEDSRVQAQSRQSVGNTHDDLLSSASKDPSLGADLELLPSMSLAPGPQAGEDSESTLLDFEPYLISKKSGALVDEAALLSGRVPYSSTGLSTLLSESLAENVVDTSTQAILGQSRSASGPSCSLLSLPRELLRHEMGGGLKVIGFYVRQSGDLQIHPCTLLLSITNMRDVPVRRIQITSLSDQQSAMPLASLPILSPGAVVDFRLGLDLSSSTSLLLQLSSDRGQFPLTISIPVEEQIRPELMSMEEALSVRRKLSGFHTAQTSLSLPKDLDAQSVPLRVQQVVNLTPVLSPGDSWAEDQRAIFVGTMKQKDDMSGYSRIICEVRLHGEKNVDLQINCDDAMLSATLVGVLKKGLSSCAPIERLPA